MTMFMLSLWGLFYSVGGVLGALVRRDIHDCILAHRLQSECFLVVEEGLT